MIKWNLKKSTETGTQTLITLKGNNCPITIVKSEATVI